ncbi:MAG: hypothetical protein V4695_04995 [Pseudomonadota bacterium]
MATETSATNATTAANTTIGLATPATALWVRLLFAVLVVWGAMIFWIAPHPPMVDFPQHAAQVTLLKELANGTSPWADSLHVNLVTPYLIGYGLAFFLSYVMSVTAALKLLLSVAYIAFVVMAIKVRQRVHGDHRLDWIFIPTFFGLCYSWGLLTFMLAAPVGLLFILQADNYSTKQTTRASVSLILVGLLLLVCHGMTFVLGWGIGLLLILLRMPRTLKAAKLLLPYVLLLIAGYVFYAVGKQLDASLIRATEPLNFGSGPLQRIVEAAYFPFAFRHILDSHRPLIPVILSIGIAPFLFGLRINWRNPGSWVPFFSVCLLFFTLPDLADNTALLYPRFSLFLLPTFVWLFYRPARTDATIAGSVANGNAISGAALTRSRIASVLLVASSVFILGSVSLKAWRFAQETQDFDAQVRKLDEGQRTLGLIFDHGSAVADSAFAYIHYSAWYQAEKKGLSDFNFAWYTPQIVRYRPEAAPPVTIGFEWKPKTFDWQLHRGGNYRYFFVRGPHDPAVVFRDAGCMPEAVINSGLWKVYENCAMTEPKKAVAVAR